MCSKITKPPLDNSDELEELRKKLRAAITKIGDQNIIIEELNAKLEGLSDTESDLNSERAEKEKLNQQMTLLERKNADLLLQMEKYRNENEAARADMMKAMNTLKNEFDSVKTQHMNEMATLK